jgi:hypothetical protein
MSLRLALLSAALVVCVAATADAQPEVRDHRVDQPAPVTYRRRPGPRFMMPLKVDLGWTGANTTRGFAPGIGGAIGIHWASLSPEPTNTDIGLGVFGSFLAAPKDTTVMNDKNAVLFGGAYLEGGHTLSAGNWWRTWATGRGEYVASSAFGNDHKGFGVAGRLSAEIFLSGVGIEPRGLFLGTYAIGVYAEAGARDLAPGVGALQVSAGLTFRTPLVFAP